MTKLLPIAILSAALFVGGSQAAGWPFSLVVDCGPPKTGYDYQITVGNGNHILDNTPGITNPPFTTNMKFRYDPFQCGEMKARFEGDLACSAGQYRVSGGQGCIDVPADTSADLQAAEAALVAANTAAAELAAEVQAEKDAATTAAAELAAEVEAEKDVAAGLAAELQLDLQTAESALAATNAALAAKNDCNVGQFRETNSSPCTDVPTDAPCPVGKYRAEAGSDCKSVQVS